VQALSVKPEHLEASNNLGVVYYRQGRYNKAVEAIPSVTVTTAPLTAVLSLVNPSLLASSIAVFTNFNPTAFNLIVTTFQMPII